MDIFADDLTNYKILLKEKVDEINKFKILVEQLKDNNADTDQIDTCIRFLKILRRQAFMLDKEINELETKKNTHTFVKYEEPKRIKSFISTVDDFSGV